jgi:2,3-bisphosphoglycerate-dependent phosphoglycerate mutase
VTEGESTSGLDLWVVRHGQSTANVAFERARVLGLADHSIAGRDADIPLSPLGGRQAEAFGRWLSVQPPEQQPQAIYCSPYARARRTLEIALSCCADDSMSAVAVSFDERLRDREMGALELLTPAAIDHRFPVEAARRQQEGDLDYRPPDGESLRDVKERLRRFLETVVTRPERRVLVVGHDATMLMVRAVSDDLSDADLLAMMRREPVRNAAIGHWKHTETWQLVRYNDTDHLAELDEPTNPTVATS